MTRILLACVFLLLASSPALAANGWFNDPACANAVSTPDLQPRKALFYCADASSAAAPFLTPVIKTSGAAFFTISRIGDSAHSGAGACEFEIYEETAAAGTTPANVTGLSQIAPDSTGDNVQDAVTQNGAANRRHLHGVRAAGIVLRFTVKAAGSEQCVVAFLGGV